MEKMVMKKTGKDITGMVFGKLTAISLHHIYSKKRGNGLRNEYYWLCKCECGNETIVNKDVLRRKNGIKSCGCLVKEVRSKETGKKNHQYTHGLSKSRIYRTWADMLSRTTNKNIAGFEYYGGRGIVVCKEWQDFLTFYQWALSNGYQDNLTIDRIDVNGNYEPSNCRWVTQKVQANNTRHNKYIEYNGENLTCSEWSRRTGIKVNTIFSRLNNGWEPIRAITSATQKRGMPNV
jgi:hypothetical protein